MSINHVSLSLTNLSSDAYQLSTDFFKKDQLLSSKKFTFLKKQGEKEKEIVDLYSINSKLSTDLSGVFSSSDIRCLKPLIPKIHATFSTILTLDIKDALRGYLHEDISLEEKRVSAFFSGEESTKSKSLLKAQALLNEKLNFIYCEGSLKSELLHHHFAETEVEYLNSREGVQEFCQLAEVFMNAVKFGHQQSESSPEKYIYSVAKADVFPAYQKSTIWYPQPYKNSVHKVDALFQPLFTTHSHYDPSTKVTVLTMQERI